MRGLDLIHLRYRSQILQKIMMAWVLTLNLNLMMVLELSLS